MSRAKVKSWFEQQRTYTRFRPLKNSFVRRQTYVSFVGKQLQMDLVDVSKFEKKNDGYRWILTSVDVVSRFAFCTPVRRKHKEFMEPAVRCILEEHKERFGKFPNLVQFDDGGEFKNQKVLPLLESPGIKYFSTRLTFKKLSIVECFNKTLKTKMWKYFDHQGNKVWYDILDLFVENVNSSVNKSIGMAPKDVTSENSYRVFTELYGKVATVSDPFTKKETKCEFLST